MKEIILNSMAETISLGKALGSLLFPGSVIALMGDLGAGKTHLTKGIASGMGISEPVNSPTFVLIREYPGSLPLYHADVYRLSHGKESFETGLEELFYRDGVLVVEWAEKIQNLFPEEYLEIHLQICGEEKRIFSAFPRGEKYCTLLKNLETNFKASYKENSMVPIALNGALGKMGRRIAYFLSQDKGCKITGLLEKASHPDLGKKYGTLTGESIEISLSAKIPEGSQVLIDFSAPSATLERLKECIEKKVAMVSGTTGLSGPELEELKKASSQIPILHATNMSLGVHLLRRLVTQAAKALGEDFDIEMVELHHRHKADAPSGTCLTLYEDICQTLGKDPSTAAVHGRKGKPGARTSNEIGVHALRLGGVVGEHTVYFCSEWERLELTHKAQSRDVFAKGAVKAAKWIHGKQPGFYTMEDVLFGE